MNGNEDGAGEQLACDCYMLSWYFSSTLHNEDGGDDDDCNVNGCNSNDNDNTNDDDLLRETFYVSRRRRRLL